MIDELIANALRLLSERHHVTLQEGRLLVIRDREILGNLNLPDYDVVILQRCNIRGGVTFGAETLIVLIDHCRICLDGRVTAGIQTNAAHTQLVCTHCEFYCPPDWPCDYALTPVPCRG